MGLLSGGQILNAKRRLLTNPLKRNRDDGESASPARPGESVTTFGPASVSGLKKRMREAAEAVAAGLDEDTREAIVREGARVFELNNSIVRSVEGVDGVFWRRVAAWAAVAALVMALFVALVFYR